MIEEEIVKRLVEKNETISSMESCTAGYFATTITNVEGSSNVLKFSAITYSNEYKIRMGVKKETIDKYSVYSLETAREMAKQISFFAESTYGVGITGKLLRQDENNIRGNNDEVFVSIFNRNNCSYTDLKIKCPNKPRVKCKEYIVKKVLNKVLDIINSN